MYSKPEIRIIFKFETRASFPFGLIDTVIKETEKIIYASEKEDILAISKKFKEIPKVAIDAAKHRIENYKGNSLLIESAERGSLILGGMAAGLTYWILQNTIGETIKSAYLESDMHYNIKEFLLKSTNKKKKNIARKIDQRLHWEKTGLIQKNSIKVQIDDKYKDSPIVIRVKPFSDKSIPPSRDEAFRE